MRYLGHPATSPETAITVTHPVVGVVMEQCFRHTLHHCPLRDPKTRPMILRRLLLYDNDNDFTNLIDTKNATAILKLRHCDFVQYIFVSGYHAQTIYNIQSTIYLN